MSMNQNSKMIFNNPQYCMGNRSVLSKFFIALKAFTNPWMLFFDKLGLVAEPLYKTRTGIKIFTRPKTTDVNDAVVVLSGREYPPALLGIERITHPVILDAGGHIGSFTLYAKSLNPGSQVVVMEPVQENLRLMKKNFALNNLSNVTIIEKALYASSGHFYLDLDARPYDAGQLVTTQPQASKKYFEIDAETLGDVMTRSNLQVIDLMKLDIEGSEYAVLAASLEILRSQVKRIIMEYHIDHHPKGRDEIVKILCDQNSFSLIYESKNILGFDNNLLS